MKAINRSHWYELPRRCCGTCKNSSSYGAERPPYGWALCKKTDTMVKLFQETTCKNYERGVILDGY